MTTTLEWTFTQRPSVLHAAAGIDANLPPIDMDLGRAIAQPLVSAINRLRVFEVDRSEFWQHLIAQCASNDAMSQMVTNAIHRAIGPEAARDAAHRDLDGALVEMLTAARPYLVDKNELHTRCQPLMNQWRTFGAGLLHWIRTRLGDGLLPPAARVVVVQPVFGGGGAAHLHSNSLHIEAVMTNPHADLPEVLRLTWMIAQLQNDLPLHSEMINRRRLHAVSGLAMIPVTLEAGRELDMATCDFDTIRAAISAWHVMSAHDDVAAEIVEQWWRTVTDGQFSWSTALTALDRMMRPLTAQQATR